MKKVISIVGVSLILVAGVLISGCARPAALPRRTERVFYINAIEIKGSTTTDKLAPPEINPESLGKTFEYKAPGFDEANPDQWQVSAYQFNPSTMTVYQGDTVKLVLFVVNGNVHKDRVEDPDGQIVVAEEEHNRGRQYEITFVAEKAGVYQLRCNEHKEFMRALITVIPR